MKKHMIIQMIPNHNISNIIENIYLYMTTHDHIYMMIYSDICQYVTIFPKQSLAVGVLTVLVIGPILECRSVRALCYLIFVRRLRERCMSPSPLPAKIVTFSIFVRRLRERCMSPSPLCGEIGTRARFGCKSQCFLYIFA